MFCSTVRIGITMLLAVYKAGIFGGSISAILINTPGAAASFLTSLDGNALARAGKAGKASCMALYASVTGEMLATLVLIFAFFVVGSMTGDSVPRGLLSCCLGMICAMVGMSSRTGAVRMTFGIPELMSGFTFLPLLIGVLVMPEVIEAVRRRNRPITRSAGRA